MRKLEKAWQAKFWKFNRFIARVLLLWLFWRTLLILSLWLSLCLKYFDKRSETFPVVICWYAAAGDTALHCTLTHIRASFFKLSSIFSLIKLFLIKYNFRPGRYVYPGWCWSLCDVCFFIFFARTVAISHVFSLIIMMLVSVYIMAQCAAADTGDSSDISHVVRFPIVTFAISTLFIATMFGQATGWLETTHSGFHSMTFLLERLFSK